MQEPWEERCARLERAATQLQERLERSERQVRTLQRQARIGRAITLLMMIGGLTFALTRPAATQLHAQAVMQGGTRVVAPFVVMDSRGQPLVEVSATSGGGAMSVFDQAGSLVGLIGDTPRGSRAGPVGPCRSVHRATGGGRRTAEPRPHALRRRRDADWRDRHERQWPGRLGLRFIGVLGSTNDGRGLGIFDVNGQYISKLGEDPTRTLRGFRVFDAAGAPVGALGLNPNGRGISLFDPAGHFSVQLGQDAANDRGVGVYNTAGQIVGGLQATTDGHGRIAIAARDGTVLFDQPPASAGGASPY